MSEKTISALVEGGKATAGPPIGPALGPLGINAGKVVAEINEKTKAFAGTTVPVKIIVNTKTKEFRIEVGTPPTSSMIKKELDIKKGSGKAGEVKVGSLKIDQVIKIANAKESAFLAKDKKGMVKEVLGTCVSMGVLVDEKDPREVIKEVDEGKYDDKIFGKTQLELPTPQEIAEMKKKYEVKEKKEEEPAKAGKKAKKALKAKAALAKKTEEAAF